MAKYRKKPIVIEAVQWDGVDIRSIHNLGGINEMSQDFLGDDIVINTMGRKMTVTKGDWIIKGVNGEIYPCKPDIFDKNYEEVK